MSDETTLIKQQNDLSSGNIVDFTPIDIEQMTIDYSELDNLDIEHPRLLITNKKLENFQNKIKANSNCYDWQAFLSEVQDKWFRLTVHKEPLKYPEKTVGQAYLWRPYWRKMYIECQEALNSCRSLAIAGIVTNDDKLIQRAKEWLISLCSYDPAGTTSREYNDEASFRVITAIAWGYDWLYYHLDSQQKAKAQQVLITRLEEIMYHLKVRVNLLKNPLNSHGVRSISSAVVPCCIALYNEYEHAKEYLKYSLKYYAEFYPPWGGDDGAWSEGPDYWNTAMAFLGEAADLIKSYTNIDILQKKFYHNTGDFILYCMPPNSKRASFGDQSSLGDFPGLKLGYNIRQFSGLTQNGLYLWYYNQIKKNNTNADDKFYNYGWWNFNYDNLRFKYLFKQPQFKSPTNTPLLKVFPQTGWGAFHSNMAIPDEHIHLIFKSSPFGSISHSHGDQNAFTLHCFGETLASITGYYIGYGVDMHIKWRRQTISKNVVLINDRGQYAENKGSGFKQHKDKYNLIYNGHISNYNTSSDNNKPLYIEGDATKAYQFFTPDLTSYHRKITFIAGKYFVIQDKIKLKVEKSIKWLLHSTFDSKVLSNNSFEINGKKSSLQTIFINSQNDIKSIERIDGYDNVNKEEYKGLNIHSRIETLFKEKSNHHIVSILIPYKLPDNNPKVIASINDNVLNMIVNDIEYKVTL